MITVSETLRRDFIARALLLAPACRYPEACRDGMASTEGYHLIALRFTWANGPVSPLLDAEQAALQMPNDKHHRAVYHAAGA